MKEIALFLLAVNLVCELICYASNAFRVPDKNWPTYLGLQFNALVIVLVWKLL